MKFSELCQFQARQLEATEAVKNHTFTLYGGSAGGGKSYFLRWIAVYLLMVYAKKYNQRGIRLGLFCEDYPALKDRQLSKIQFEFPAWLGTLNKTEHEYVLDDEWGGGVIAFRNLDDPSKYLSSEFVAILVDELTKNQRETFDFLNMRRRWAGIPDTKFIGASNPGGIGHGFVKKLWIDRDFSDERFNPKDFAFVRAKAIDNKYLGVEYDKQLDTLPETLRKAYKDGNWDIFAGQFFTEFSREVHVCEPFPIPEGWRRIRGVDYGNKNPSGVLWAAIDFDGDIWIYRELYEAGHTYEELACRIVDMEDDKEKIEYSAADTSMFSKTLDTGKYGNDIMADSGVPLTQANKERIPGWNLLRQHLKNKTIHILSSCKNLIRTLPVMVHDERIVEDLAKNNDDHLIDSLRYIVMSLPDRSLKGQKKEEPPSLYASDPQAPWNQPKNKDSYNNLYSY